VRRIRFRRTTGSGLPGEVAERADPRAGVERANCRSQGVTASIQLVAAMAVFANEGRRVTPRITRAGARPRRGERASGAPA
jgi:hypothetical protein